MKRGLYENAFLFIFKYVIYIYVCNYVQINTNKQIEIHISRYFGIFGMYKVASMVSGDES